MAVDVKTSITILTTTLNAADHIEGLADSISKQTDQDYEWLVVDGGSTDGTVEYLRQTNIGQLRVVQTRDFGIYDAFNQGLRQVTTAYYLPCGADDRLDPDAVKMYREQAVRSSIPDFVAAPVRVDNKISYPKGKRGLLVHSGLGGGIAASHSVGLLIKTDTHRRFGLYSRRFPIAADQLFFGLAMKNNSSIGYLDRIAGSYSPGGSSGQDAVGTILEQYRIQLELGRNATVETLFMFARIIKNLLLNRGQS